MTASYSLRMRRQPESAVARARKAFRRKAIWTVRSAVLPAEELIAELCATFPCAEFGFDGDVRNAGYIANWIELLKADKRALFTACSVPTVNRRGVPTPIGELSR
jgi:antirestriction protein ArdC